MRFCFGGRQFCACVLTICDVNIRATSGEFKSLCKLQGELNDRAEQSSSDFSTVLTSNQTQYVLKYESLDFGFPLCEVT